MSTAPKISTPDNFLSAKIWEKTFGEDYEKWRVGRERAPGFYLCSRIPFMREMSRPISS